MPKASEVAAHLRKLAEALDKEPEATIRGGWLTFHCNTKEEFLATMRLLPRPLIKEYDDPSDRWARLRVMNSNIGVGDAKVLHIDCSVPRSAVCRLKRAAQEAEYECEPLLSQEEEASIGAQP